MSKRINRKRRDETSAIYLPTTDTLKLPCIQQISIARKPVSACKARRYAEESIQRNNDDTRAVSVQRDFSVHVIKMNVNGVNPRVKKLSEEQEERNYAVSVLMHHGVSQSIGIEASRRSKTV